MGFLRYFLALFMPLSLAAGSLLTPNEIIATSGVSFNLFLDRELDSGGQSTRVFQRYKATAPFTQWRFIHHWHDHIHTDFQLSSSYDIDPYATNTINNGAETLIAHSAIVDANISLLYRTAPGKDFFIGFGIGAGDFALHTDSLPGDYATHYLHGYLPFLRCQNTYQAWGYKAQWEGEIGRTDAYYFSGSFFDFKHHLWLIETPTQDQGLFLSFSYWDLTIPGFFFPSNNNDSFRSIKAGWEVNFH